MSWIQCEITNISIALIIYSLSSYILCVFHYKRLLLTKLLFINYTTITTYKAVFPSIGVFAQTHSILPLTDFLLKIFANLYLFSLLSVFLHFSVLIIAKKSNPTHMHHTTSLYSSFWAPLVCQVFDILCAEGTIKSGKTL